MAEKAFRIELEEIGVDPDADNVEVVETESVRYVTQEIPEFDRTAVRSVILAIQKMAEQALVEFDKATEDHDQIDIAGSLSWGLRTMCDANLETFRAWHNKMQRPELAAKINQEVKRLLGEDVDIDSMSEEECIALLEKVQIAALQDLVAEQGQDSPETP